MLAASTCAASPYPPSLHHPQKDQSFHFGPASRRQLLTALVLPVAPLFVTSEPTSPFSPAANARGLFQMPPPRLTNRYFLVRAGESEYESLGIINTNPVAKTSIDSGLSEKGQKQMVRAAFNLKEMGVCERNCWIWPSITQRAYQAAEIIASVNGVSRNYIVPEYSFLDARGLGAYEGKNLDSVSEVYASDSISPSIKPPPIDDGTPNESVADVFVRVTQLMSILETQYSEDTVIIVSPDSDNLSVLQAGIVGLDLRRHRELSFAPGEVRFVDTSSVPTYKQPASGFKSLASGTWEENLGSCWSSCSLTQKLLRCSYTEISKEGIRSDHGQRELFDEMPSKTGELGFCAFSLCELRWEGKFENLEGSSDAKSMKLW